MEVHALDCMTIQHIFWTVWSYITDLAFMNVHNAPSPHEGAKHTLDCLKVQTLNCKKVRTFLIVCLKKHNSP